MQSSTSSRDTLYISLGERRGKSDLARFSLDLSWARAVSDSARLRAYPSPPMSGSPPLPPRRNLDSSSNHGHGSYGSSGQDVYRGAQTPQLEQSEQRGPPLRAYSDAVPSAYPQYRAEEMPPVQHQHQLHQQQQQQQQHYQQQRPVVPPQQPPPHHHGYSSHPLPPSAPFSTSDRPQIRDAPDFSSPKQQRKTKGHVASACVPCKRAHLRCDAQRPCSRCMSNGKEEACVDVQHKKRGRPRLRDERESRYDVGGHGFPPPDASMRRPLSLYAPSDSAVTPGLAFGDPIQRSNSYRVLKSHGPGSMVGHMPPRFLEHASPADANIYGSAMPPTPRLQAAQDPICAYLTMDMQIAKATQSFGEAIGLQSVISRKLQDVVAAIDRDKVTRLQRTLEDERREREPNYLPPIYLAKFEEDRVIQSVGFSPEEILQVRIDHQEMIAFQGSDGQQRAFQLRFGLAKKEATYFIALVVQGPVTPQTFHQPSTSPYSTSPYSTASITREAMYGYAGPSAVIPGPGTSPYGPTPSFGDPRGEVPTYRTPGPHGSNIAPSSNMPSYPGRSDYSQGQTPYQTPRSELPQTGARQHDLQLPPIRDQRAEGSSVNPMRRRDDRTGRVDIGGLLESPDQGRRGP